MMMGTGHGGQDLSKLVKWQGNGRIGTPLGKSLVPLVMYVNGRDGVEGTEGVKTSAWACLVCVSLVSLVFLVCGNFRLHRL